MKSEQDHILWHEDTSFFILLRRGRFKFTVGPQLTNLICSRIHFVTWKIRK